MYQIWQDQKSGTGGLFTDLLPDEVEALEANGLKMVKELDAKTLAEAQKLFIDWCHEQCPDAKVERVSFVGLRASCSDGSLKKGG